MPTERGAPDDPREWLNRARSSLARVRLRHPDVYLEDLCFDAQQASEKALKAVLLHCGIAPPRIHDLGRLLTLVEEARIDVPEAVRDADSLTPFAVIARYPSVTDPVTEEQYEQAMQTAEVVVRWAKQTVLRTTGPNGVTS